MDLARSLGADHVIDHGAEDFTRANERYDVLFDIGGSQPLVRCRRVMTRNGILIVVGAPAGRWLAPVTRLLKAAALSPFVTQRFVPFLSKNDSECPALLGELAAAG